MPTRRSFRCCKNGLAVFFLDIRTTTILRAAGFGATLGPDGGYSVAFQALFLCSLERLWLDLRRKGFTFVIRTTWPPRKWRWTWSISVVLASFCVRQWRKWSFEWLHFRPLWRKMLGGLLRGKHFFLFVVLWQTRKRFYILLVVSVKGDILEKARPSRLFQSNSIAITPWYPKYSAFDLTVRPVAIFSNRTCRSFLTMCLGSHTGCYLLGVAELPPHNCRLHKLYTFAIHRSILSSWTKFSPKTHPALQNFSWKFGQVYSLFHLCS